MQLRILQNIERCFYEKKVRKVDQNGNVNIETSIISNFIIKPIKKVSCEFTTEYHVYFLYFSDYDKEIKKHKMVFDIDNFESSRTFKKFISRQNARFSFIGSDNDLELIKSEMAIKTTTIVEGLPYIGLVKEAEKWKYIDKTTKDNKFVVEDKVIMNYSIKQNHPNQEELLKISSLLFNFNDEKIVYPILAGVMNCFFNARLKDLGIKTPISMLIGESGSGKSSTLEDIFIPFFGEIIPEAAAKLKEFSSLKTESETNLFPHVIEEYKEHKLTKYRVDLISTILRSLYDGHSIKRGNSDQTVNEYVLRSPLVLVGETEIEETAVKERSMLIYFSKETLNKENKKIIEKIQKNNLLLNKLGSLILDKVLNVSSIDISNRYDKYYSIMDKEELPNRIKNNIIVYSLCYSFLVDIFEEHNINIKEDITKILLESQRETLNNNTTKSVVENTIDLLSNMIENGYLIKDVDFCIKDNNFCIRLKKVYDKINKYMRDYNIKAEIYEKRIAFQNQLERSKYFISKNTSIRNNWDSDSSDLKSKNQKCYVLDLIELSNLDFCITVESEELPLKSEPNKIETQKNIEIFRYVTPTNFNIKTIGIKEGENDKNIFLGKIFLNPENGIIIPTKFGLDIQVICINNLVFRGKKIGNVGDNINNLKQIKMEEGKK